jgi:hypothetical protein
MPQKNIQASMKPFNFSFISFIYKWRFFIALLFAIAMLLVQGCKKVSIGPTPELYQKYFEENVLNRDFIVSLATDNGTDSTTKYTGWVFKLLKNTYYDGPMTAIKNGVTYTGTWSCNEDFGKLTININQPSIPPSFTFLNRAWRFTKKDFPVMELAPWGTLDAIVLNMQRL